MFKWLPRIILKGWLIIIIAWVAAFAFLHYSAPDWEAIVTQGEFAFLPEDSPSQIASRKHEESFPDLDYGSSLLYVIERRDGTLGEQDFRLVNARLIPLTKEIADKQSSDFITGILSPTMPIIGDLLQSDDRQAALVLVQLKDEFLHEDVWSYINELESEIERLEQEEAFPSGLEVYLSGSAVLGRDITKYRTDSANWIENYTVWLVMGLLVVIFRAPLIALVPLITLTIAVKIAMVLLSFMAQAQWLTLFDGIEVYLTVIAYGAGVDYSMFLISRFREELERDESVKAAMRNSVEHTGTAIAASGCTEILGIAMLTFATYGKLQQSGLAISFALVIMLFASLTLTPSLLRFGRRWAFWPVRPGRNPESANDLNAKNRVASMWESLGNVVVRRPWTFLIGTLVVMAIPASIGFYKYTDISYGLFAELPRNATSSVSLRILKQHFPVGTFAPVTVMVENPDIDFATQHAEQLVEQWSQNIIDRKDELKIANIQSYAIPLGLYEDPPNLALSPMFTFVESEVTSFQSAKFFVAQAGAMEGHLTRLSLTLTIEPFSQLGINQLSALEDGLIEAMPNELREGAAIYMAGPTASLRSMQEVAIYDQKLLFTLVTLAVLAVLVVLLRKWLIPLFLVASVGLTFIVTLGVTWCVFRWWLGSEFVGLDWSVPLLLFTLLMAVGADYNVLLVSRSDEEAEQLGLKRGIVQALTSTGAVITGCGIVMAGTFATLLIGGELASMRQLGFALAFGMLLDTFVIRPLFVPAFLLLRGRKLKKYPIEPPPEPTA